MRKYIEISCPIQIVQPDVVHDPDALQVVLQQALQEPGKPPVYQYVTPWPIRLIVVTPGRRIEEFPSGAIVEADIQWMEGMPGKVLSGQEGKQHRRVIMERILSPLAGDIMPKPRQVVKLCALRDTAPRADRTGGARGPVGHPLRDQADPTEMHCLTLPVSLWQRIDAIGEGRRSEGVRRLAAELQAHAETLRQLSAALGLAWHDSCDTPAMVAKLHERLESSAGTSVLPPDLPGS